ncbi:hypothetical protein PVL29_014869 [Vitis rotundifolia]|uniref:Uncharacterized protein n=1 Tax=Vitis rotundifolia TaxID=103349 RepID=A0AA38ZIC1_VITRO|nr:hypothetical protein PVL29_014869 [Vitis rotundifolia]
MAAAYKGLLIPLIILAQALFQVLQIASNWWMAWANPQTEGGPQKTSTMVLLGVFMAFAFGSSCFIFVRAVLVATFGLEAVQKLFVSSTNVSIDQSVVDLDIPFRLGGFASTTIQLLGIVGLLTKVTWQVLLLVIPMAIACLWMQDGKLGGYGSQILRPSIRTGEEERKLILKRCLASSSSCCSFEPASPSASMALESQGWRS